MNYAFKVTTAGRALLAAVLATGTELEITRVAVGKGRVSEDQDLALMTDLVEYVAEGTVAQRRHKDNVMYLMVQYASNYTPGLGAFYLAEFAVWAKHPVTGASTILIYATLGDLIQPVMGYSEVTEPDVRQYPLAVVLSDEINVTISAPAGLVTYADLQDAVTAACRELVRTMASGGIKKVIETTVEPDQWQPDLNPVNGYIYYCDLEDSEITDSLIPNVTIAEDSLPVAFNAGVCQTASTLEGILRLKCVEKPTEAIMLTCTLSEKGGTGGGYSGGELPPASSTTRGGVMVQPGSGLNIDEYGNISVATASEEESADVIEEVFGENE